MVAGCATVQDPGKSGFLSDYSQHAKGEDLQTHFQNGVRETLTEDDAYQVVEGPGPGTAEIHIGITDVDDTIGALNISIYTKITGAGDRYEVDRWYWQPDRQPLPAN
jgi:hypothetical protein